MTKPNEYRKTYVLSTDASYTNTNAPGKGAHCGEGTLHRGRVVWLENDPQPADSGVEVPAYAEGVGVVLLASTSVQSVG